MWASVYGPVDPAGDRKPDVGESWYHLSPDAPKEFKEAFKKRFEFIMFSRCTTHVEIRQFEENWRKNEEDQHGSSYEGRTSIL